jgi:hypothetical protein
MRALPALAFVACLILAGCRSGTVADDKPAASAAVHAGDCIAKEIPDLDDKAPDYGSTVDCTEPHIYEVSGLLSVPARFLRGSTRKQRLANRRLLGSVAGHSSLAEDFRDYTHRECGPPALVRAGMDGITIGGKSMRDVGAELVMGGATTWINLSPPAQWVAGGEKVICSVRFTKHFTDEGEVAPSPITARFGHPAFYDFLTDDFPAARRQCITYDSQQRYALNPCTQQHYAEIFFSYDAAAAFGEEFVKGIDIENPSDAQWEKLGDPCADALSMVLGKDVDPGVTGGADFGVRGWFQKSDVYTTYCLAVPYKADDLDLPAGSLIGKADKVAFVPISGVQAT